jgi:Flp pilus assembly protein TadG
MSWLKRANDDRGAVAVLVAILLGSGVLVLSVGLVIDSGRLFLERRVLQTSADTVAVTVAQACATREQNSSSALAADCENPPANIATAMDLNGFARIPNDANQTEAYLVCGSSSALSGCPSASIGQYDCQATSFSHFIRAYTRTTQAGVSGGTALFPVFAPLLQSAPEGTRMAACSQVAWVFRSISKVPNSTYMPFAISACQFDTSTRVIVGYQSGSNCTTSSDFAGNTATCSSTCQSGVVGFNYSPAGASCASVSGGKLSLNSATFGAPSSNICVKTKIGDAPSPGLVNLRTAISGSFSNANTPESVYTVPIFDKITTVSGQNAIHVVGFGYFKLLGYKFPGATYPTTGGPTWSPTCGATGGAANTWCIWGRFEPHVYSNSPSSELTEIAQPSFWDGTFAIKRIP